MLICIAGAAYAWDRSKIGEIANGVKFGGVPVGGLATDQARKMLRRQLVDPLKRPVTVTFQGKRYVLSPKRLRVHADLNAALAEIETA